VTRRRDIDVTDVTAVRREKDRVRQARSRARKAGLKPPPKPEGHPTLFTPEIVQQILASLEIGNTAKDSALAAGIGESTLREWCREKPSFAAQVERARAKARQRFVGQLAAGAAHDWRAALAALERLDPENWGRRERIDVMMDVTAAIKRLGLEPTEEEAAVAEAQRLVRTR